MGKSLGFDFPASSGKGREELAADDALGTLVTAPFYHQILTFMLSWVGEKLPGFNVTALKGKGSWQSEAKDDLQLGREQYPNSTVAVGDSFPNTQVATLPQ